MTLPTNITRFSLTYGEWLEGLVADPDAYGVTLAEAIESYNKHKDESIKQMTEDVTDLIEHIQLKYPGENTDENVQALRNGLYLFAQLQRERKIKE